MIFNFLVQLFVAVALTAVSYALAPKPPRPPPRQQQSARGSPLQEFTTPTADSGRPIPVVFGTVVVRAPNVLHTAEKNSAAIQEDTKAEYRLTMHYGICQGRIDAMRRVRINEKTLLAMPAGDVMVDLPNFNGGEEKEGGVRGRFLWQDGSFGQTIPVGMAEAYGETPSSMTSYRGIATAMFKGQGTSGNPRPVEDADPDNPGQPVFDGHQPGNGFLWGQSPFIPPVDFMVTRISDVQPGWLESRREIPLPADVSRDLVDEVSGVASTLGPNINPIHVLREVLLDDVWGAGFPDNILDDASFRQAAIDVHQEALGVSFLFQATESVESIVSTILEHVEAVLYLSPLTGRLNIDVLRGGYDKATLPHYDETSGNVTSVARKNSGEITNEVIVNWVNPAVEKNETIGVQNLAGISRAGAIISNTISLPGIRDGQTALKIAERELASTSEQTLAVEVDLDRRAWGLVPGNVFRLSSAEDNIDDVVLRALQVDYGRPGEDRIKVNAVEDVFARTVPNFDNAISGSCPSNPRRFNIVPEAAAALLQWDPPLTDGGSPILGYEFQQDGGEWLPAGGPSARSHRVADLVDGTTYTFRTRAYNTLCPGVPSVSLRIGPDASVKTGPGVVRDFRAIAIGTEVEVHFAEPESDGGATIIRYEYSLDMGATWVVIPEADNFLHRIIGLTPNQQYPLRMRAVNAIANGAETFDIHVTIRDLLAFAFEHPPQADGVYARGGIASTLIWWDNPYAHYQNHAVAIVYRHDEDDFSSATQVGRSAGISHVDTEVPAGVWFYWVAWQSQSSVIGDPSEVVSVEVTESPATAIARISAEILADPLTSQLLAPIDDLAAIPDIQRISVPAQEISRSLVEGYFRITGIIVDSGLGAEAAARQVLEARTTTVEGEVQSNAAAIGFIQTDLDLKATVSGLEALTGRVAITEDEIDAQGTTLDALDATIAGVTLGPTPNVFTGASRTLAEMARNDYLASDPAWLAQYDADATLHIELRWEYLRLYQRRVNGNWIDHGYPFVRAAAVQGLDVRVRQTETTISSQSTALANLRSEIANLDEIVTGYPLGPAQNVFTGADRAAAIVERDAYAADNATWLAAYDGNAGAHIQLVWGNTVQYQHRDSNAWEDVGSEFSPALALATAFDALQTRVTMAESAITSHATDITALETEVAGKADSSALTSLESQVTVVEGELDTAEAAIAANAAAITQLTSEVAGKASATALTELATRVTATEGENTTQARQITSLETSVSDLDSRLVGRTLGPAQNVFNGANKAAAEAARDAYAAANPAWLPQYDADDSLNIELRFGTLYQYQRRVSNTWQDNGEALVRGAALTQIQAQVTANENAIEANASEITQLETEIDGKASSQAVTDLSSRVSTTEDDTEANALAVTQLRSSLGQEVDTLVFQVPVSLLVRFTEAVAPGTLLRAGAGGTLADFVVQVVVIDGNKFTVAVTGDGDLPTSGTLQLQPAGFNAAQNFANHEDTAAEVDTTGDWNITVGGSLGPVAEAVQLLETRVQQVEDVEGATSVATLARWLVKTQVGDLVGGVGLLNDGSAVRFYVTADRFAIIPPGVADIDDARLPFVVSGGQVFINSAVIANASIGALKAENAFLTNLTAAHGTLSTARIEKASIFDLAIGNAIQSDDYEAVGAAIAARPASLQLDGILYTSTSVGTAGNGYEIEIVSERSSDTPAITAVESTGLMRITLRDTATTGFVNFDRADIVSAVNAVGGTITAVVQRAGNIAVDFSFSDVTEQVFNRVASSEGASSSRPGEKFRVLGNDFTTLDSVFGTNTGRAAIIVYDSGFLSLASGFIWTPEFVATGTMTIRQASGSTIVFNPTSITDRTQVFTNDFYDSLSTGEAVTITFSL